jgi:hypothetical protein
MRCNTSIRPMANLKGIKMDNKLIIVNISKNDAFSSNMKEKIYSLISYTVLATEDNTTYLLS